MAISTREYLSNLYENYRLDRQKYGFSIKKFKCLGAMEAVLVILGTLSAGTPFKYHTSLKTFKLFGLIPIKLNQKETYEEMILRLTEETLNEKNHE